MNALTRIHQADAYSLIIDMRDPVQVAAFAEMMERRRYPTMRAARDRVSETLDHIMEHRRELRTVLNRQPASADAHPLNAMVWNAMYRRRWSSARNVCSSLRRIRAVLRQDVERVERYCVEGVV